MRGVAVQLPERSQAKLLALQMARDGALDAGRGANSRLQSLPRDADQRTREALERERDQQNRKHGQLHQLVSRISQWLVEMPANVTLELTPTLKIERKDGETVAEALGACRDQITAVRQHLAAVRSAPLPPADMKQLAVDLVSDLMRTVRPSVSVVRDQMKFTWRDDIVTSKTDVLALLAFVAPGAVLQAIERQIDAMPQRADSMPKAEREARLAALQTALDEYERAEESLVERAAQDGVDILRRVDASPACVLGVQIKEAEATQAA